MNALADFAILAHGWRRAVMLGLAGTLAGLSAAPFFLLPALFIGFPVLVWALDGAEPGAGRLGRVLPPAFGIGFWFALGYFAVSLHWIGAAFFVDGGVQLAAMPFAILALAAVLALFWGAGTALAHLLWSHGAARILALAGALSIAEFARGHLFTGLPFNLVGYALTANLEMMQAASLVGVYGLTLVALVLAGLPALVWPAADRTLVARLVPVFVGIGAITLQLGWGYGRLTAIPLAAREDMLVRIVQPAIPQDLKWQTEARAETVTRLLDLSAMRTGPEDRGLEDITHLIWPEAALPFFISDEPELFAQIARALPDDLLLLAGVPRTAGPADGTTRPFNSIFAIAPTGEVISSYDKTHLVPFGEYLPFQDQLETLGFSQFVHGADGWAPGTARRLMELPGTPAFLPLVCYEAIYPGGLGAPVREAQFILVATNDAWFDGSIGLPQHFHHHRMRALEEGIPLVRAANSGISGVIDPLGRITQSLGPGAVGAIDATIPQRLEETVFARLGHLPFALGIALVLLAGLAGRLRR
ncbi:apolipoprotein N-acyltransferase [Pelagibacterium montanilacus]|uniref:apolipoprotein N-acyltransferase n=1 Tax=Pelagibacterium montanilacus TaxID=2185280 RepID=UPI000F8DC249|nr:apolipoprotein N-acyltransferase [Pelagibacterium montanilacus]